MPGPPREPEFILGEEETRSKALVLSYWEYPIDIGTDLTLFDYLHRKVARNAASDHTGTDRAST